MGIKLEQKLRTSKKFKEHEDVSHISQKVTKRTKLASGRNWKQLVCHQQSPTNRVQATNILGSSPSGHVWIWILIGENWLFGARVTMPFSSYSIQRHPILLFLLRAPHEGTGLLRATSHPHTSHQVTSHRRPNATVAWCPQRSQRITAQNPQMVFPRAIQKHCTNIWIFIWILLRVQSAHCICAQGNWSLNNYSMHSTRKSRINDPAETWWKLMKMDETCITLYNLQYNHVGETMLVSVSHDFPAQNRRLRRTVCSGSILGMELGTDSCRNMAARRALKKSWRES